MKKNIFFLLTIALSASFAFKKEHLFPTGAKKIQVKRNDDEVTIVKKMKENENFIIKTFKICRKFLLNAKKRLITSSDLFEKLEKESNKRKIKKSNKKKLEEEKISFRSLFEENEKESNKKKLDEEGILNILKIHDDLILELNKNYIPEKKILKIFPQYLLGKKHAFIINNLAIWIREINVIYKNLKKILDNLQYIEPDLKQILKKIKKEKRAISYQEILSIHRKELPYGMMNIKENIFCVVYDIREVEKKLFDRKSSSNIQIIEEALTILTKFFELIEEEDIENKENLKTINRTLQVYKIYKRGEPFKSDSDSENENESASHSDSQPCTSAEEAE